MHSRGADPKGEFKQGFESMGIEIHMGGLFRLLRAPASLNCDKDDCNQGEGGAGVGMMS